MEFSVDGQFPGPVGRYRTTIEQSFISLLPHILETAYFKT